MIDDDSDERDRLGAAEEGEDDAGAPHRRAGPAERKVVYALNSALRVSRLHALDNVVAQEALAEFAGRLSDYLSRRPQVTVIRGDQRLYINGAAIKGRRQGHSWQADFLQFMERMGIGGLTFRGSWDEAAVRALLEAFAAVGAQPPEERLKIVAAGVERLLRPPAELELLDPSAASELVAPDQDEELPDADRAAFHYARLLALVEASHAALRESRPLDAYARQVRQTLMKVVEELRAGAFQLRLLGLTVLLPGEQDPWASHAVNTCVLSLAMGRLLGLARGPMADLGFAALFHDAGRALVDRLPSTNRAGERRQSALGHVGAGVTAALRGRGHGDAGLLRLIVAQEVHRVLDGYPEAGGLRPPHLYSRVVAAADAFDRLCQGTPWSPPLSPVGALGRLGGPAPGEELPAGRLDPAIHELLVDVLGPYPRGTLLLLPGGELVVVVDGGARRQGRPLARRLLHADGAPDPHGTLSEVAAPASARVLEPAAVDLDWRRAVLL